MGRGHKAERLGEEIRKITSELLIRELKDPRLNEGMVSVTAVDVTSDGSFATVYLTLFQMSEHADIEEKKQDVLEAMQQSKGIIKREIGKRVKVRHIPEMIFKMDNSLDYGRHIEKLIDKVHKDEE